MYSINDEPRVHLNNELYDLHGTGSWIGAWSYESCSVNHFFFTPKNRLDNLCIQCSLDISPTIVQGRFWHQSEGGNITRYRQIIRVRAIIDIENVHSPWKGGGWRWGLISALLHLKHNYVYDHFISWQFILQHSFPLFPLDMHNVQ